METRIIGRDIMTGVEKFYIDCDDVLNHYDSSVYNIPVFKSLYLDQPRQFKGKHWRSEVKQYWIPPSGLVFDPCIPSSTKKGYIKARNLDTFCIFIGYASQYLQHIFGSENLLCHWTFLILVSLAPFKTNF